VKTTRASFSLQVDVHVLAILEQAATDSGAPSLREYVQSILADHAAKLVSA
jgi:hypothetical protein